jgi:hypothetical protein
MYFVSWFQSMLAGSIVSGLVVKQGTTVEGHYDRAKLLTSCGTGSRERVR